jgi:hypothetical protein
MYKKSITLIIFVLLLALTGTAQATDYYVSPSGDDDNSGTSPELAWATIGKVNTVTFSAGDSILFEGGQTFSGQLVFNDEAGTSTSPITVSSYGTGRATLSNSTMGVEGIASTGLGIYDNAGFEINNLILVGPGNVGDRWDENVGLRFDADLGTSGARVDYIRIDNVEVSEYSGYGILFMGAGYTGFRDVEITNCVLHHIGKEGICTKCAEWPMSAASHNDFYIADCEMYHISGVGTRDPHSGSGINLSAIDGGLIEFCVAHHCGYRCLAEGGGPLGIWCWEAENLVFQFNEVYDQQTLGGDGGGYDLDGGSSFCIVQYNYSHDNFGGNLLMQFGKSRPAHDYIFRYNISSNDCQLNGMGAVTFYTDVGTQPYNVEVYNNTFYLGPDSAPDASAIDFWYWKGGSYSNVNLRNNIFMAEAGKRLITYDLIGGITFQNNIYWQSGAPLVITDPLGTVYNSLDAWRAASGQEMLDGQPVGMEISPQLVDVHDHPVLGPHNLANLGGYELKSVSQCRDTGLDLLTLFGIDPGTQDYYSNSIPQGSLFDISAHEYPGGGSAPAPDSTPPAAPASLAAAAVKSSQIDLDWADNGESDMSHYSVKRSTSPGGPYTQIISNLNASAYSDKSAMPSAQYYYVVSAVDTSSNESGSSSEASATTPAYSGVLLFSDGFESGDFATGGWITTEGPTGGDAVVTTAAAYTGTYGAQIGKLASIQKNFSTVGYTDIRIRYMRNTINTERRGCTIVWWDGDKLHPIEISIGQNWGLTDIMCGPEADNKSDLYIFFRENGPGPQERTFVDDVEIWGVSGAPDTDPPSPDPMTFASPPAATGHSSIEMTATTATDSSGVEYYFTCVSGGGNDSDWQDDTYYQDTGLSPETQYCYTVKARDKSVNQNETAASGSACATTDQEPPPDTTPPSPDPMTFASLPAATGSSSIEMTATTATDESGVEYYFTCVSGGGNDSAWQDETYYEDSGLNPETQYCYTVKARDKSVNQNETAASGSECATTSGSVTLIDDDFEGTLANWNTDWDLVTTYYVSSSHSIECSSEDNDLISIDLDTSGASSIAITFMYRVGDIDDNDNTVVQYYNGTDYITIDEIGDDTPNTWLTYSDTITDSQYFKANFRLKIEGTAIDPAEYLWIDDVLITME